MSRSHSWFFAGTYKMREKESGSAMSPVEHCLISKQHNSLATLIICSSARLKLYVRSKSLVSQCHQSCDYIDRLHSKYRYVFATRNRKKPALPRPAPPVISFRRRVSRSESPNCVSRLIESSRKKATFIRGH